MMSRLVFLFLLFISFLVSCQNTLSREDLLGYTLDVKHGLYKKREKAGVLVEVVYRPGQLIASQILDDGYLTDRQIDSVHDVFDRREYFLLRLSKNSREIENTYSANAHTFNEVNSYLSFEIGKDVYLVQDHDTLRVSDLIRTRTLGASHTTDILFAFEESIKINNSDVKFVFDDTKFNTALNEFDFDIDDIQRVSAIKIISK